MAWRTAYVHQCIPHFHGRIERLRFSRHMAAFLLPASRSSESCQWSHIKGGPCRPSMLFTLAPLSQMPLNHVLDVLGSGSEDFSQDLLGRLQLHGFEINSLPRRNKLGLCVAARHHSRGPGSFGLIKRAGQGA